MRFFMIPVAILTLGAIVAMAEAPPKAAKWDFEDATVGALSKGWTAAKTGEGEGSIWKIVEDQTAPNGSKVLAQTAESPGSVFNLCVAVDSAFKNVELSVSFKAVKGKTDQGGGLVWRYLDANNYYPERDGRIEALDSQAMTTSELLAVHLKDAKVVKAFNAILQGDLEKDGRPAGTAGRRALPIAGDDAEAKRIAIDLIDQFGFDVVDAGALSEGWRFQRAMPAYCVPFNVPALTQALAAAQRGVELPHGSWRT